MVALGPLSTDLYLPSLPSLTSVFNTSVSRVQATLSVFIAGFAVATLIYGPVSDRFGRRSSLMAGLSLFVLGSVGCMAADSIETLITWRFVQAIGGCAGPVLARAVVRDVYGRDEAARMLSYMASAMALAPAVAPVIGGWLHVEFGWRSHFVALAGIGAALTLSVFVLLSETNKTRDTTATQIVFVGRNIATLFKDPRFVVFIVCMTFAYGALFTFISVSAFVVIDVLGVAPDRFGYLFFFVAFGFVAGGMTGGRLVKRVGIETLVGVGIAVGVCVALVGLMFAGLRIESIATVIVPVIGTFFACGLVLPNATAGALMPFPQMAGTASSAIGFFQMSGGAFIGYIAGGLHNGTTIPLFGVMVVSWVCAATAYVSAHRRGVLQAEANHP